MKYNIIENIAI